MLRLSTRNLTILAAVAFIAASGVTDLQVERFSWDTNNLGPASRSFAIGLVWVVLAVGGLAGLRRPADRRETAFMSALGVFFIVAFVASVAAVDSTYSIVAWLGFGAVAIFVLAVVRHLGVDAALFGVLLGTMIIATASLLRNVTSGGLEANGRLAGFSLEPNLMGQLGGLAAVVALTLWMRKSLASQWLALIAFVALVAAVQSGTRTTWPALLAALVALGVRRVPLKFVASACLAGAAVLGVAGVGVLASETFREQAEDVIDLSGRPGIWEWSLDRSIERPVLGHGIATGRDMIAVAEAQGLFSVTSPSSHNLALEIFRETGILGLAALAAALAAAQPWRDTSSLPLLAFLAVSGLTMPTGGLAGLVFASWMVVMAWTLPPIDQHSLISAAGLPGLTSHRNERADSAL